MAVAHDIVVAMKHGGKACFICVFGGDTDWGRVIVTRVKSCYVDKFDFKCTKHEKN